MDRRRRQTVALLGCATLAAALLVAALVLVAPHHPFERRTRHARPVTDLTFSRAGSRLLSISRDAERELTWPISSPITGLALSRDGATLVIVTSGAVFLETVKSRSGAFLRRNLVGAGISFGADPGLVCAALSPDGAAFFVGGERLLAAR